LKDYYATYLETLHGALKNITLFEREKIDAAAAMMAEAIELDELIHVFGTGGHSTMGAMELFWRAGSLAPINPLLEASLLPSNGALHSNYIERTEGLAGSILKSYEVKTGEVLIIVNAYGINAMTIDAALEAKKMGLKTICITNKEFADKVPKGAPARHSSNKNLYELADIYIDNNLPYGDACVSIEGMNQKIAPSSTILNSFCLNLLVIGTVGRLLEKGIEPPVWMSANLPEGDTANKKWHKKYNERIKHLR